MQKNKWTFGLAIFFIFASFITLFFWIPNDIETGVIEKFRRRVTIGDAMAPTMVAWGILLVSIGLFIDTVLKSLLHGVIEDKILDSQSFRFLLNMMVVIGISLFLMLYIGPLLVDFINLISGENNNYRLLKDNIPHKYIGYVLGGFIMVFGTIGVIENKFSANSVWVSIIAVAVLTFLYDVPFDNLLLPPNGDY